jgi:hypothetical protein
MERIRFAAELTHHASSLRENAGPEWASGRYLWRLPQGTYFTDFKGDEEPHPRYQTV